ncbi:MAG TPA: glyoxalase [Advenella kashmirensis]|uniref:Glyoxalase n=2 Tax=Advenella TaxID=290425 RepID=A0A356LGF2_9BURK|nr:glyoxalase [Advenella kashmirensis]
MVSTNFGKAIPVLASLDMKRTLSFYKSVLEFKTSQIRDTCDIAARGETELRFWNCSDRNIAENTSCYRRVSDIQAVHNELSAKLSSLGGIVNTAWCMDELYVFDPDGNLIKFGQERADLTQRISNPE